MLYRSSIIAIVLLILAGCGFPAAPDGAAAPSDTPAAAPDGAAAPSAALSTAAPPSFIAYVRTSPANPGERDIYIAEPDGAHPRQLTDVPGNDISPAWSPDGTRIAFTSTQDSDNPTDCLGPARHLTCAFELYVINVDGTGLRRVTVDRFYDREPSWSPDGTQLVYQSWGQRPGCSNSCHTHLAVVDVDGATITSDLLTDDAADDEQPDWAPDGTQIAFVRTTGQDAHIHTIALDSKKITQLTKGQDAELWPAWSPDSAQIAYMAGSVGARYGTINIMDRDGSRQRTLRPDVTPLIAYRPSWSPDGTMIAFVSDNEGEQNIYTIEVETGVTTRVTDNQARYSGPAWSRANLKP